MGRRKEAWKLASRIYDFSLDSADSPLKSFMYGNAYFDLAMAEADRVTHNNWRKMHGMVMHRRCGKRKLSKNGKPGRQRRNSGKKI